MIINFIAYLDPSVHHGGGEQITSTLLEEGERRGHTIHKTFQNPGKVDYNDNADLNILWDIYNCPEQNNPFDVEFLMDLVNSKIPYIYGSGAYEDICTLGTLPCRGETDGKVCSVLRTHRTFGEGGIYRKHPGICSAIDRSVLLKNASMCIIFSVFTKYLVVSKKL